MENQFFNREKTNALKKSMRKDEIEKEMINEIFTRERLVYDNEKGKKIIVKEKIDFSLNQSTKLREKEFHERNKANLMEKSSKLLRLTDQRHAEKCTFQPTTIKKTKKKGKLILVFIVLCVFLLEIKKIFCIKIDIYLLQY